MMKVSRSCYYAYVTRQGAAAGRIAEAERVRECFWFHGRKYGSRRIGIDLGLGRFLVRRLMREQKLVAIQPKPFKPQTTDSRHGGLISPNLLKDAANRAVRSGEVVVGDITYLPLRNGKWCYLAMFQDKLTRRIIGWAISDMMTAELVVRALQMALRRGLIKRGGTVHTDRGSQYVSNIYRHLLAWHEIKQSMSGRGNCYDNAQAESFFSRFKAELVEGGCFESVDHAQTETFAYIDGYYNRIRLHSSLGYKSPIEFERQLTINNHLAEISSQPVKRRRAMLASNPPRNNRSQTHQP